MSRSSRRIAPPLLALSLLLSTTAASADEPLPATLPPTAAAPLVDLGAPAIDFVAPVIDLAFGTADLGGQASIEEAPSTAKVLLNSNVLFPKDSPRLLPTAHRRLREVAAQIKAKGAGTLRITGYTDDLGSAAHGLTLSRQRAAAVSAFLRPLLPAADFPFTLAGRGEADPAAPNDSEANRRKNRRVEIVYGRR